MNFLIRPSVVVPALLLGALLVGACGPSGEAGWTYAPLGPTPAATGSPAEPSPGNGTPAAGNVIELEMTGDLRILQAGQPVTELHVTAGETYTFRVDNVGNITHNFYLGPRDRLAASDVAGLPGLDDWQSGPREFSWTADQEAAGWQFACTVLGHYQLMNGDLIVDD